MSDCESPYTQSPLLLAGGGGNLGQRTQYSCAPHCLMQGFYRLTGLNLAETKIAGWCGTTSAGTSHAGIETAVAQFNNAYSRKIKIEWHSLSDYGKTTDEQFKNISRLVCEKKYVFFHLLYRSKYGHYETFVKSNSNIRSFEVANSLGKRNNDGFIGYIENRSYDEQKRYIQGISQPSVAVMYEL